MFEGLSCDSKGGESAERHVRACTFLFILHEGGKNSREKKAERAENPFPFFLAVLIDKWKVYTSICRWKTVIKFALDAYIYKN